MSDVSASSSDKRPACFKIDVCLDQLSQIVDLIVKAHPAVVSGAVFGDLVRGVIVSKLVWLWQVSSIAQT